MSALRPLGACRGRSGLIGFPLDVSADGPGGGRAGVQGVGGGAAEARGEEAVPTAPDVAAVGYPRPRPPLPRDPVWRDVVAVGPSRAGTPITTRRTRG